MTWQKTPRFRKYQKGSPLVTMVDKTLAIEEGWRIWWNGRSYDPRWIAAWPWAQVRAATLFYAVPTPEYRAKLEQYAEELGLKETK